MISLVCMSRVADLLQRKQYLHRLLPDIMEPLVMQAAALYLSIKEGLADPRDMKIRPYKPEDLTAKEGQPDAADIIFNHPGYSDFSSHHIKLIAIALLSARESSFDHSDHIVASRWGSCDAVSGCDQKSDRITYCAVDDSSVVSAGVGERVGMRLRPCSLVLKTDLNCLSL
ncbi:hypothetical protein FOMG_15492 [Fusarium oxysporum f. sp. melonis 26406]|uniref:Uncharacterized protein n=1 Tax=Fusarium oxysporum f. sp. melonis 26406 TaxID=1089452 RepID=W9ZID6_FUSOX|nr:hypothetical protein FOMG_15492 [Fusarium oxysporum f. sp. melonis 26406]